MIPVISCRRRTSPLPDECQRPLATEFQIVNTCQKACDRYEFLYSCTAILTVNRQFGLMHKNTGIFLRQYFFNIKLVMINDRNFTINSCCESAIWASVVSVETECSAEIPQIWPGELHWNRIWGLVTGLRRNRACKYSATLLSVLHKALPQMPSPTPGIRRRLV